MIALFLTANPVANIIGAPFSGVILDHAHWLGLSSWRWLLILEGVPAVVGGVLTYFLLPNRPAEAFLTPEERGWIYEAAKDNGTISLLSSQRIRLYNRVAFQREMLKTVYAKEDLAALGAFRRRFGLSTSRNGPSTVQVDIGARFRRSEPLTFGRAP